MPVEELSSLRTTKVTMMLADYATAADGKLTIVGGGWTIASQLPAFAIAVSIEMPWGSAGQQHTMRLELVDDQGRPVIVPTQDGPEQPLVIDGQFELAPVPGMKRGTPLSVQMPINFVPAPPIPVGRHEWRLEIDGETHEDWRLGFTILPNAQSKVA